MTQLDDRIRALVTDVIEPVPNAPAWNEISQRLAGYQVGRRRHQRVVLAAAAVVVLVAITIASVELWGGGGSRSIQTPAGRPRETETQPSIDKTTWAGPDGTPVHISPEDYGALASGAAEVVPARDENGTVVGYIAESVGFIPKSIVETPGFNLDAYRAQLIEAQRADIEAILRDRGMSQAEIDEVIRQLKSGR